jgi:ubiquinone/menaquinone biosynthesis C-methylase UbiE
VTDDRTHRQRIREAFTTQAPTFEDPSLNFAFTSGLPWLLELASPQQGDVCLDVAAGTGLITRALAPRVTSVVAVDTTIAMLRTGADQAAEAGVRNVVFVAGDASALPCPSGSFTLVVTRFSLHHFEDPLPPLREMVRALRPGGRLVVHDLMASTDPEVARAQDRIENLRDPSHLRMPSAGAVGNWLANLGMEITRLETRVVPRSVEHWLAQARTPAASAAQIRQAFRRELSGGVATGLQPHEHDDELWFRQAWEITVAAKPASR